MRTSKMTGDEIAWSKIRRNILKRDGYHCRVYGCPVRGAENLSPHHIVPRADSGSDDVRNLIALCHRHHDEIEVADVRNLQSILHWAERDATEAPMVSKATLDTSGANNENLLTGDAKNHTAPITRPLNGSQKHSRFCSQEIVTAIRSLRESERSWVDVAGLLRYPPAFAPTLSAIARDVPNAIAEEGEIELRVRLEDYAPRFCAWSEGVRRPVDNGLRLEEQTAAYSVDVGSVLTETRRAVNALHGAGNWRAVGMQLGISHSIAHAIGNGLWEHVRWETVRSARRAIGLTDPGEIVQILSCPSCGGAHTGDCHGRPVAQVVTLAPGEQVTAAKRRPQYPPAFDQAVTPTARTGPRYYTKNGRLTTAGWQEYL